MNLDFRITIQQYTTAKNGFGEDQKTWATFKTVWASERFKAGRENTLHQQTVSVNEKLFTLRYLAGITEKMRISYNSEIYNIKSINIIQRKKLIEITAIKQDNS